MSYERQFIHTFREAVRDASIPVPYKVLLFNMSTYSNSDGGDVYPSQESLARASCSSVSTVRRHLKHLQVADWIELVKRGHSGGEDRRTRSANRYQLHVGSQFTFSRGEVRVHDPMKAAIRDPARITKRDPKEAANVPPSASEPQRSDLDDATDDDGWTPAYDL